MYLKIQDIDRISDLITLNTLCDEAGLSYSTIFSKLKRFRTAKEADGANTDAGELLVTESEAITEALRKRGFVLDFEVLRKPRVREVVRA